ncbi:MAG TPA: hypothetical protein VK764_02560 [Terracidiphilus sp.]|jgi:hypothetical protein|nr:hypothetical protein [Terracidiphilus sp.]
MKTIRSIAGLAGIAFLVAATPALAAQQPAAEHFVMRNDGPAAPQPLMKRFMAHNAEVAALQPSLITPLVAPDPRLVQYAKLSFSNQYTPAGTQTVNYGNARGGGIIAFNRFEFDVVPPPYIQHNSSAKDGFGDMSVLGKVRLASGNAEHGNFVAAAMLSHTFATGSHKNGALTDAFCPTLVAGLAFKKQYDMVSSLGGVMPAGKIATQGRTIAWNELIQMHATRHLWFEAENNATFYFAGPHDGKMQNFGTPAVFYVVRRKEWQPTHPFLILDTGMQVATSSFHIYNHNLISEVRILF